MLWECEYVLQTISFRNVYDAKTNKNKTENDS